MINDEAVGSARTARGPRAFPWGPLRERGEGERT